MADNPRCPNCGGEMQYVVSPPEAVESSGDKIVVPLHSDVFRCPDHGMFRFYISGAVKPYPGPR